MSCWPCLRSRQEKPDTPAERLATASIANAASAFAFLPATAIGKAPEGLRFGNRERFSSPCPSLPTPPSQPVRTHDAAFPPRRRLALPTPPPSFIPSGQIRRWLSSPLPPPSSPLSRSAACAGLPLDQQPAVPPRSPPLNGRQRRGPLRTGRRLPLARSADGRPDLLSTTGSPPLPHYFGG